MNRARYNQLRRMAEHHLDGLKVAARRKDFAAMRHHIVSIKDLTGHAFEIVMNARISEDEAEEHFKELGRISRASERYEKALHRKTMNDPHKRSSYAHYLIEVKQKGGNWRKYVHEMGQRYGETGDYAAMKSVLTTLRAEGHNDIAAVFQAGAKVGADHQREQARHAVKRAMRGTLFRHHGRDPRKKPRKKAKRKMAKNHPMRPYFAWVKKNHKKFQKADGRLDMKRMWKYWKTHHA